ncbi:MAG: hypothetical protein Kow0026_14660 [Oricola sp.]
MTRKPYAAVAALCASAALVAACSVIDLAPVPVVEVPYAAPAPGVQTAGAEPVTYDIQAVAGAPASHAVAAAAPDPAAPAVPAPLPQSTPPQQVASAAPAMASPPVTLGFPAVSVPRFGGSDTVMPAEEVQCRKRLKRLGVQFRDIPRIRDSASCGIDWPVEVTSLGRSIRLAPAAKLNCAMAEEAALWAQRDLAPAARTRYLSGIAEVRQMSSYSCRKIAGLRTWSEHSKGNALDIGAIKLKNGRVIDVHKPGLFAFRERSFLRSVRGQACDRFGTVLGPGYNRDHADHFHLDLKDRRRVACH